MKSLILLGALFAFASGKPFYPFAYQSGVAPPAYVTPTFYSANVVHPTAFTPGVNPVQYSAAQSPIFGFGTPFVNKYHAQAEDGSYSFGYTDGPSSRFETKNSLGVVQGAFNYIDPTGKVQTQQYVADAGGFRVAGTNLPFAPKHEVKAAETEAETNVVEEKRVKRDIEGVYPASTRPLKPFTPVVAPVPIVYSVAPPFPVTYTAAKPVPGHFPVPVQYTAFPGTPFFHNSVFPRYNYPAFNFREAREAKAGSSHTSSHT